MCEDNLTGLLKWVGQIERKMPSVDGPKEGINGIEHQINLLNVQKREYLLSLRRFELDFNCFVKIADNQQGDRWTIVCGCLMFGASA